MSTAFPIPVAILRKEFAQIRARSHAKNHQEFLRACRIWLQESKIVESPDNWVLAAKRCRITCRRCDGTGRYITGMNNGQPIGPGGPCYRCNGKGWQNDRDVRRNFGADMHQKVYL